MKICRLHLVGLAEDEMAKQAKIDKSASPNNSNTSESATLGSGGHGDLYAEITREVYDIARQTRQESYQVRYDPSNQNRPKIKLGAISRIQAAIRVLVDLQPDLESLAQREELHEFQVKIEALKENPIAKKIVPGPYRIPRHES